MTDASRAKLEELAGIIAQKNRAPRRRHVGWITWNGTRPLYDDGTMGGRL